MLYLSLFMMHRFFKIIFFAFAFAFMVSAMDACKSSSPYNPYLHMKTKPSEAERKVDKKIIKQGNRAYKRQLGKNRRRLFGLKKAP